MEKEGQPYQIEDITAFAKQHHLENLIAVDNTASKTFVEQYESLIEHGFDLVSSNKIANTLSFEKYKSVRKCLDKIKSNTSTKPMWGRASADRYH